MSTLKVTNIQHGSATNVAMVLDSAGTVKAYSTISVGNVTPSSSGAGITFPATQSASSDANTLDDYEEGTWTPTIVGSTSAGTASYTVQNARYTKIGRMVQFECYIAYSGGNGTGNLRVAGLPFTAAGTTFPPISCITENIAWTASYYACPYVQNGDTYIVMAQNPTGGGARNAIAYDAAGEIQLAGTYSI